MTQSLFGDVTVKGRIIHSDYYDNGNSGKAITVDSDNGNYQKITLTNDCTITLRSTTGIGTGSYTVPLLLLVVQDATGGHTVTWSAYGSGDIRWHSGSGGAVTTAASSEDILFAFGWGSGDLDWAASMMLNFQ